MSKKTTFETDIDRLAHVIANDAMAASTEIGHRLEAFRCLIQYGKDIYAKREKEAEGEVFDFKAAQRRVKSIGDSE